MFLGGEIQKGDWDYTDQVVDDGGTGDDSRVVTTPFDSERPVQIARFSQEARDSLERRGYIVYELTGQSIATHREAGRKFFDYQEYNLHHIEALPSRRSEVAINPQQLFLPESRLRTIAEHLVMVELFSTEMGIEGVKAIVGSAPDYIDLAFTHFDATGERLFGEDFPLSYTSTTTRTSEHSHALVGIFDEDECLLVRDYPNNRYDLGVSVSPLVVPAQR